MTAAVVLQVVVGVLAPPWQHERLARLFVSRSWVKYGACLFTGGYKNC